MSHKPFRPVFFGVLMTAALLTGALAYAEVLAEATPEQPEPARLVVLLVFDQMRGDYPQRWQELYDKDGFGRLLRDGAWYQNCHYPYAFTLTACGHASISTGCPPSKHGIIANDWYDRNLRQDVSVVATDRWRTVPQVGKSSD